MFQGQLPVHTTGNNKRCLNKLKTMCTKKRLRCYLSDQNNSEYRPLKKGLKKRLSEEQRLANGDLKTQED